MCATGRRQSRFRIGDAGSRLRDCGIRQSRLPGQSGDSHGAQRAARDSPSQASQRQLRRVPLRRDTCTAPSSRRRLSAAQASAPAASVAPPTIGTTGCPNVFSAPGLPDNVRANQDCGYRFQSEEWVAVNPKDASNVVVSQNDSSLNGNRTGVDFSLDGGRHFGDSRLPSGRITLPQVPGGEWSFDFFSDPVHAFDAHGNLYYVALGADFAQDAFDGLFVWKSNSCLRGSALHSPGVVGARRSRRRSTPAPSRSGPTSPTPACRTTRSRWPSTLAATVLQGQRLRHLDDLRLHLWPEPRQLLRRTDLLLAEHGRRTDVEPFDGDQRGELGALQVRRTPSTRASRPTPATTTNTPTRWSGPTAPSTCST